MVSTRKYDYAPVSPDPEPPPTLFSQRERWTALLLEELYQPIVTEVLAQELPKYTTSNLLSESLASITQQCILILASAPLIFAAAVDGTLAHRFPVDVDLQREYQIIQERAHIQPSIYIHFLADEHGIAPTAEQYLLIRNTVLMYLTPGTEHQELAHSIDNMTPPIVPHSATSSDYRKYLWTKKHSSPKRTSTLLEFCSGVLSRYNATPPLERNTPFAFPPAECGYSANSPIRLAQHRHRQSSNYVMNLVEDICTYLYTSTGQFTQRFSMHQYIIYLIFRPEQAAIAEIFCSGLLQVWIEGGGGLNAYPAGRSVASARKVSREQWEEHERWVEGNTSLVGNLKVQREMLEGDILELDKGDEEVWREALDDDKGGDGDDEMDGDYVDEGLGERFGG